MAKGILGKLGAQFGLGGGEEAQTASPLSQYTPEQLRAADVELKFAARGKRVTASASEDAPAPFDEPAVQEQVEVGDAVDSAGNVNFPILYSKAGIEPAKFTAEQALDLIQDCDESEAARKQTIKVIKAFGKNVGATPEEIVVDAVTKQDALDAFNGQHGSDLVDFQAKIKEKREQLQAQLSHLEEVKELAEQQYQAVRQGCLAEHARLEKVRDFFRQEVPAAPAGAVPAAA